MPDLDINSLAEKLAAVLKDESFSGEDSLEVSLAGINRRLERIEQFLDANPAPSVQIPQTLHPSLEKFDVIEAISDQIIENKEQEKACTFEPNGKPCDHCSMCSSRGF